MDKKLQEMVSKLKKLSKELDKTPSRGEACAAGIVTDWFLKKSGGYNNLVKLAGLEINLNQYEKYAPKILVLDIETSTMEAHVFQPWGQDIRFNQVIKDWSVLCWSAKWLGEEEIFQASTRKNKDPRNDKLILKKMWKLLDEADVVITQNGIKFDVPKLNARFIENGYFPPSSFIHVDTCRIAKKAFGFTYNSLEAMSNKLCTVHKKENHGEFPGMSLWTECQKGNQEAWDVMERYNKKDILVLEELYFVLRSWDKTLNYSVFDANPLEVCGCGSYDFEYIKYDGKIKYKYTKIGRYEMVRCVKCGAEKTGRKNLHAKQKMESMRK